MSKECKLHLEFIRSRGYRMLVGYSLGYRQFGPRDLFWSKLGETSLFKKG